MNSKTKGSVAVLTTERSEGLLDVLGVMLTLQLAPEAVNKLGCKAGFEVGIGLCSFTNTNNYKTLWWPLF